MSDTFVDLGFARVDLSRGERCGRDEVIFGQGKTPEQVAQIAAILVERTGRVLATRVTSEHCEAVRAVLPGACHHEAARCLTFGPPRPQSDRFHVGLVAAGTSDLPVQEEAAVTLEFFGWRVERFTDVGVAGLHRLLGCLDALRSCHALIVVAGMEGALPSVVGGLVSCPVVAVPTSVGYGANLGGVTALLGMLTSCSSGVTAVNIDNGFGAACAVDSMLRMASGQGRNQ